MTHRDAAYLCSLLAHQMAGGFEFFQVGRKVKSKDFDFFAESQKDMIFFKLYELFNIACFCLAPADHLIFVDVQKVDLAGLRANN